jgi:hypothetical protein
MVFNTPVDFIRFIKGEEGLLSGSLVLRSLEDKRKSTQNCCKCVRGDRIKDFLGFYYSLGDKLSEQEKDLLKQAAGDILVFKNGDDIFLEIK